MKRLLKPVPSERPTAEEALKDPWLTSHVASTEHDLAGLREHFDPRARWRAAFTGVRALNRFNSVSSRASGSSGGWRASSFADTDTDDDDGLPSQPHSPGAAFAAAAGTVAQHAGTPPDDPGENDYVTVTAPEEDSDDAQLQQQDAPATATDAAAVPAPSEAHELRHEAEQPSPLHEKVPTPLQGTGTRKEGESVGASHEAQPQPEPEAAPDGRSTPELTMPGSFDVPEAHHHQHLHFEGGWLGFFKKMHIRQ